MRQKSMPEKEPVTQVVKSIRRATRRHFSRRLVSALRAFNKASIPHQTSIRAPSRQHKGAA
jgi:hypothetical protein